MNEEERTTLIVELEQVTVSAKQIEKDLQRLRDARHLEPETFALVHASASRLVRLLRETSDLLKGAGADWIREAVTGWYRLLHFDMCPVVEVAENEVVDPMFESIIFKGDDTWEVIMSTTTHGRERVVVHSDGATWQQVYSAERIEG